MQTHGVAAVLLGGMFLAPVPAALGQTTNLAYAVDARPEYVVFLDRGTNRLSSAAADTVRIAAGAAKSASVIRLVGHPDHVQAVKNELIRDGIPAGSIVVGRASNKPFPTVADGIAQPVNRRVEIMF